MEESNEINQQPTKQQDQENAKELTWKDLVSLKMSVTHI